MKTRILRLFGLFVLAAPLLLAACTEQVLNAELDETPSTPVLDDGPRFRNGQALGRAHRPASDDGGTAEGRVGVIVSTRVAPAKFFDRFKFFGRYGLAEGPAFQQAFQGLAVTVDAGDWAAFRAALLADADVAWFEPDVVLDARDPMLAALGQPAGAASDVLAAIEARLAEPALAPLVLPTFHEAPALRGALTLAAGRGAVVSAR